MDWSLDVINAYCKEHFGEDVRCEVFDGKGRIMIAKRAVAQGQVLFAEPPLHIVKEDDANAAFLTVKRLCEENSEKKFVYEPLWYWTALCSLTKEQLNGGPKHGSLPCVTVEQQRRLLCLYHEPVHTASDAMATIVKELGLTVSAVVTEDLLQAWILNCFEHSDDPLGYSAYFASSFVSHSCGPNAIWSEADDGTHVLRARQDISIGDEVSISYLEEQVLLHAADTRKRSLRDTKLFECTCERCAVPASTVEDGADMCRGFYCTACGECGIFYPLRTGSGKGKGKRKGKQGGLIGVACTSCGAVVSADESARLIDLESGLEAKLRKLDDRVERMGVRSALTAERVQDLLKVANSGESNPVGPQHWLCDRVWEHLQNLYEENDQRKDLRRMLDLRVEYQRKGYPGLSAALAWTLEQQAGIILRHIGFGATVTSADKCLEGELTAQVESALEDSARILRLMFGEDHEHYTKVEKQQRTAREFLQALSQVTVD